MLDKPQAGVLRHARIPLVSYPYEWTFGMLRDAALLQLDLLARAIDAGLMLKDASPYNVQWQGAKPVFVDIGSFERLREGEPWAGYRQFCSLFLNPLLLQAYRGIDFQPWLRGSLEGISPSEADRLFSLRDHFRRGVFTNVHLHARLEAREAAKAGGETKQELKKANFKSELIAANVARLRKLVARLDWRLPESAWTGYRDENTYSDADDAAKRAFVEAAIAATSPGVVWDLGANDGAYSRLAAAAGARQVLALDSDHATVEALYRSLREEENTTILPLVADLANPSPGLGWRGLERRPLVERGAPDRCSRWRSSTTSRSGPTSRCARSSPGCARSTLRSSSSSRRRTTRWSSACARASARAPTPTTRSSTSSAASASSSEVSRREELPSGVRILYALDPR